jgi:hypothetical protein
MNKNIFQWNLLGWLYTFKVSLDLVTAELEKLASLKVRPLRQDLFLVSPLYTVQR